MSRIAQVVPMAVVITPGTGVATGIRRRGRSSPEDFAKSKLRSAGDLLCRSKKVIEIRFDF
jgi:hypothetical protein